MSRDTYFRLTEHAAKCPFVAAEQLLVGDFMADFVDSNGCIKDRNLKDFHNRMVNHHQFCLRRRNQLGVRRGGWHLFYIRYHLLVRVKTSGTEVRHRPHMTISLAVGSDGRVSLEWDDELQKFSLGVDRLPKAFSRVVQTDWRSWRFWDRAAEADETWAQAVHFDFVEDCDMSSAATVHLP